MKDIQQTLFAIFEGEHAEHLEQIRSILGLLSTASEAEGKSMLDEAFRRAHTLKGAARAVDLKMVEELANGLESVLARVREGHLSLDREVIGLIHQTLDSSEEYLTALQQQRTPAAPSGVIEAMAGLLGTPTSTPPAPVEVLSPLRRRRATDLPPVIPSVPPSKWSACRARTLSVWCAQPGNCW